ncbi:type IV pilus modification protein PilV [Catenovulum sediminis]|uniref:type IV pilus modification protein PilV n=1 Tax=Catenovulum sediminis TaxID=1740262 RepID=UPI00117F500B|nr:type IV pilus modification protein PilV [Catenovulum sediminis]
MRNMKRQSGFSLIELIIAMSVMAIGIVGAVATQATAKRNGVDASQRSLAVFYAHDILERMRLNKSQINDYVGTSYGTGSFSVASQVDCTANNYCTPTQLALYDTFQWHLSIIGQSVINSNGSNVGGLLKPTGCIENNDGHVTIVVSWMAREASKDAADNGSTFEKNCGETSNKRRQVTLSSHIY